MRNIVSASPIMGMMEDNRIVITRLANGWAVALPLNYPDSDYMNGYPEEDFKDPLLRKIENSNKEDKVKVSEPSVGHVPASKNVFIFAEFDLLLAFLKETVK